VFSLLNSQTHNPYDKPQNESLLYTQAQDSPASALFLFPNLNSLPLLIHPLTTPHYPESPFATKKETISQSIPKIEPTATGDMDGRISEVGGAHAQRAIQDKFEFEEYS
jgi:hypothetical protein